MELRHLELTGATSNGLNADDNGNGRVTTQILEITGGSDLSEAFDITATEGAPEPGMLVCIDPDRPGELKVSDRAYDHTLAGVISGAGGVRPGMLMGQAVPQEAYRTSEGAMMGAAAQAIQGLAQNPQFMKWLTGAFQAAPSGAAPGGMPMGGGGTAGGG